MKWLLNRLWTMMCDQRGFVMIEGGDENNENKDGEDNGGEPGAENKPDPEADPEDKAGEEGEQSEGSEDEGTPAEPKYGEYGDDPHEAAQKAIDLVNSLKEKGGATERNLAKVRQTLNEAGISLLRDDEGNIQFQVKEEAKTETKDKRFTDAHKELLGDDTLEALDAYFADKFDAGIAGYEKTQKEKYEYSIARRNSNAKAFRLYPTAQMKDANGNDNPNFNRAFYDRATEIWKADYSKNPKGEMMAMHEAAIEMKISPISLEEAKKAGYNKAKNQKKVLGPAGGGSGSGAKGVKDGVLSRDAYLKLDQDAREKYDKERMGIK